MEKITPSAFFTYSIEKGSKLTIRNLTQEADNYLWSFGDGETSTDENPVHEYEISFYGDTIYLTATNSESGCTDQHMEIISGGTSINDFNQNFHVSIYPNPNQGMFWISTNENMDRYDVKIFNLLGEVIYSNFNYTHDLLELNFEDSKTKGIYIIELRYKDKIYKEKLVIE
jgi:PKD repeat protein